MEHNEESLALLKGYARACSWDEARFVRTMYEYDRRIGPEVWVPDEVHVKHIAIPQRQPLPKT